MMSRLAQLRKGTTTLAVLAALERGEVYGYGLRREVAARTKGLFSLNEGALYPVFHRLERKRFIKARREKVSGRWRRYYGLTPRGRQALVESRTEWEQLRQFIEVLLR